MKNIAIIFFFGLLLFSCELTFNSPKQQPVTENPPQEIGEVKGQQKPMLSAIEQEKFTKFLKKWSKVERKEFEDFFTSVEVVEPGKVFFHLNSEFSQYNLAAQEREVIPIMKQHLKEALSKASLPIDWAKAVEIKFYQ